jgi:dienelactone hydrolase
MPATEAIEEITVKKTISLSCCVGLWFSVSALLAEEDPSRVLSPGQKTKDARIGKFKTLNGYFPMRVPRSKEEWEARRTALREQVLVANGLWPMPPKTPLNPVIHGKIDREEYTIEKVFFSSYPGHYVSGSLYRPKGKSGKLPGVLCPHGHWRNGRFFDAGEATAKKEIENGAEKFMEGARHPLQARCVQLARMGCVVFHYDMVGVADSARPIGHATGFADAEGELRLQSAMGLQTWNSIRSLDFLLSLPEIDEKRIGVTGASGGGTQTFILGAIDDRPAVAFPAVMVSTGMQGGCVCENCSYLRQDAGNIDLAGLFAPRPLGMSGAGFTDWTREIETKGLPELKALYKLYDAEDRVMAKAFLKFDHNYNQVSRELMYGWFNKHLKLGLKEPIQEKHFVPVPPGELSVYDAQHPLPRDATSVKQLRDYMTETSNRQIEALMPKDEESLRAYRRIMGTALRVMAGGGLPTSAQIEEKPIGDKETRDEITSRKFLLGRKREGDQVPAIGLRGPSFDGTVVVWIHPAGKSSLFREGKLVPEAKAILDGKAAILAIDVFETGELQGDKRMSIDGKYAGYTFGYNRPLLANRIHDILTAVAHAKGHEKTKKVHLVGFGKAGPWVLLARGLCGDAVERTAADVNGFRFDRVHTVDDEMMLPGAWKYGGLGPLAALAAPGELLIHHARGSGTGGWTKAVYVAAKADNKLTRSGPAYSPEDAVKWLLR